MKNTLIAAVILTATNSFAQETVKYFQVQPKDAIKIEAGGQSISGYATKPEDEIKPIAVNMVGQTSVSQDLPVNSTMPITIQKVKDHKYRLIVQDITVTVPPVEPPTVKPISLTGLTPYFQGGTGGTYTSPASKLDGLKTIRFTYNLAPGGTPASTTVTVTIAGKGYNYTLTPTSTVLNDWSKTLTVSGSFPASVGTLPITIKTNRGLTLSTILIE